MALSLAMVASVIGDNGAPAACNCGERGDTFGMMNGSEMSLDNSRNLTGADIIFMCVLYANVVSKLEQGKLSSGIK